MPPRGCPARQAVAAVAEPGASPAAAGQACAHERASAHGPAIVRALEAMDPGSRVKNYPSGENSDAAQGVKGDRAATESVKHWEVQNASADRKSGRGHARHDEVVLDLGHHDQA